MKVLVLTGGGARGAWQIGKVKKLVQDGYSWDAFVGTSVGAINATGMASFGVDQTIDLWRQLNGRKSVMKFNWAWPKNFDGIFRFDPLAKLLNDTVKWPLVNGSAHACMTDLQTLSTCFANSNEIDSKEVFLKYVIASCVIAGIQKPVDGRYVDGGHREFAPLTQALYIGGTEIDIVSTSPLVDSFSPNYKPAKRFPVLSHAMRGIEAMAHEIWLRDLMIGPKVRIHAPKDVLGDTLNYDRNNLSKAIESGLNDEIAFKESGPYTKTNSKR